MALAASKKVYLSGFVLNTVTFVRLVYHPWINSILFILLELPITEVLDELNLVKSDRTK